MRVASTAVHWKCHTSQHLPDIILHSLTRPSTAIAVIEGLGTRLQIQLHSQAWSHSQAFSTLTP